MKQTTEAIVLGLSKHSDKISLLHVYSRTEGRLMLQVYGANGKKKQRAAYQPLSLVELTYDSQPTRSVPVLSTIDSVYLPEQTYNDIRRQSVALFVTEVVMLTLTHPLQDEETYRFLVDFVHELNDTSAPENLHITFLLRFAEYLGIGSPSSIVDEQTLTALVSRTQRQQTLRQLCDYYLTHLDSFRLPKSLEILIEVFD